MKQHNWHSNISNAVKVSTRYWTNCYNQLPSDPCEQCSSDDSNAQQKWSNHNNRIISHTQARTM